MHSIFALSSIEIWVRTSYATDFAYISGQCQDRAWILNEETHLRLPMVDLVCFKVDKFDFSKCIITKKKEDKGGVSYEYSTPAFEMSLKSERLNLLIKLDLQMGPLSRTFDSLRSSFYSIGHIQISFSSWKGYAKSALLSILPTNSEKLLDSLERIESFTSFFQQDTTIRPLYLFKVGSMKSHIHFIPDDAPIEVEESK
jgi:hypothetical protein